jgi:hypothetical protein
VRVGIGSGATIAAHVGTLLSMDLPKASSISVAVTPTLACYVNQEKSPLANDVRVQYLITAAGRGTIWITQVDSGNPQCAHIGTLDDLHTLAGQT